jgi:hypothetical protein
MKRHSLDLVVVVALFCVYAACALFLCVIGAEIYRDTAETMQQDYDQRTSVLYVAEKVRQNDIDGAVRIDSVEGTDALVLIEKQSGRDYEAWLFVQDQTLYEGLFAPGDTIDVKLCQPIMPMEEMVVQGGEAGEGMLSITFSTVDGQTNSIDLWLRSQRSQQGGGI